MAADILLGTFFKGLKTRLSFSTGGEKDAKTAYDLWAAGYDAQPGNLMLELDRRVFSALLANVQIKGRRVADIGCGTGRHWPELFARKPATLHGFDVSGGMLRRLKQKYPDAEVCEISDNGLATVGDSSFDFVVSTLTIAHIENLEEALAEWSRILDNSAGIIITDFHPVALASGGKRTFNYRKRQVTVRNFVHPLATISSIMKSHGFSLVYKEEVVVDESLRHWYRNAPHVYEQFKGLPIIYGMLFRREG